MSVTSALLTTLPFSSPALLPVLLDLPDTGLVFCTPMEDTAGQAPDLAFTYLNPAAQRLLQLPAQPATTYRQQLGLPLGPGGAWYEHTLRTGEPTRTVLRLATAAPELHLTAQRVDTGLLLSVQAISAETASAAKEAVPADAAEQEIRWLQERSHQMESVDTVLAGLQEFVYLLDLEGRFRYVNKPLLDLWGLTLEQAVGRNFHDLSYPDSLANQLQAQVQQVVDTKRGVSGETPYTSPTGTRGYYEYTLVPLFAADGSVEAVGGRTQPVTERRQAEEALRRAHERTVDILESTTDAFYALDADFRFTYVNQRAARLWGRDQNELIGRHYWTEFPAAVGSESYHHHYQVQQTGQPVHYETVSPLLGTWIDASIHPGRDGGVSVFFRDITARKQAETALRAGEAKLTAVFEALPVGVGVIDAHGNLVLANRRMQQYLPTGMMPSRNEVQQVHWRAYHPDGRLLEPTEFPGARALRGEKVVPGTEMLYTQDDGTETWTQVSAVPLSDSQGRITGHVTVIVDIDTLKRTDEALRASEQRLRALIGNLPGGAVFVVDGELRYQLAEGEALREAGFTPADLLGRTVREAMPPSLWDQHEPGYRTALAGNAFAFEQAAHGRTFITRGVPLLGASGQVESVLAVSYDISARKQVEEALRQSEEQFRLFVTTSTDTLYKMSPDWRQMLTLEGKRFLTDTTDPSTTWVDQYIPLEDQPGVWQAIRAAIAGKTFFRLEHRVYRADGSVGWTLSRALPVLDAQGEIVEWFGAATDITARKQAEEDLRRSEERLQKAMSIDTVGVLFFDLAGHVHDGNAAFERMSGYSRAELASGQVALEALTTPEFIPATNLALQELRTAGQNTPFEKQYRRPDGSLWWGLSAGKRLSETECVKFVLDITEAKQTEQDLRQSQQQLQAFNAQLQRMNVDLDNFIYTASHDLKAPITNIEGLIYALQAQLPTEVQQTYDVVPLLTMMQESVARFQRTIEHLSDVIKLQKAHEEPLAKVALLPVIEDVRRDLRPLLAATSAQVYFDIPEGAHVSFSAKNLRSVVYNLLSNAVKYCHPQRTPQVHIRCYQEASYTVLRVQDNGLGIEPGRHAELFQMFRRLHSHVAGSGIGLYMVKRIVENAGGKVEVQSEPGVGSAFSVYFPAASVL